MLKCRTVLAVALAAAAVAVSRGGVQAQEIRFSPALGLYLPLGGALIDEPSLRKQQIQTGFLFGRLAAYPHPYFAVEGVFGYGRGMVAIRDSMRVRVVTDVGASLWIANLRGLVRFSRDDQRQLSFYSGAGVGLVGRSGEAFLDTPSGTSKALLLLFGANTTLGHRNGGPAIRLELEDHITWAQFAVGLPNETRVRLHHDIIWTVGLSFVIRR